MSREHIATVLKQLREKTGLTANEVGAIIGKSGKTVNAWENNHGQPDAEMLIKLCDVYNVDDILNEFRDIPKENKPPLAAEEEQLINIFRKLNPTGKKEAIKRVNELTKLTEYIFSASNVKSAI